MRIALIIALLALQISILSPELNAEVVVGGETAISGDIEVFTKGLQHLTQTKDGKRPKNPAEGTYFWKNDNPKKMERYVNGKWVSSNKTIKSLIGKERIENAISKKP
ncbi:hypothetical protein LCGC14_2544820 [marine sediment metagenome]|uniref:Uncharacterized protein n=1 Tax=marine sediment metagenome TaxID=412755 RepID=A0A0F9AQ21_9ZZZZ